MKKGEEIWVRWGDGSMHQLRILGGTANGWRVLYVAGDLKGREALIERETMREISDVRRALEKTGGPAAREPARDHHR